MRTEKNILIAFILNFGFSRGGGAPAFPCMCLGFLLSRTLCFPNHSAPFPGAWDGSLGGMVWARQLLFEFCP